MIRDFFLNLLRKFKFQYSLIRIKDMLQEQTCDNNLLNSS